MKIKFLFLISIFQFHFGFGQTQISFSAASNGQTFNTCNGFIIDSGGQGGAGYGNNENTTITICPDNPDDIIAVVFNFFNLSTTDDNPAPNQTNVDYMSVYDGTSTAANTLGTYTGNQLQGVVIQATQLNPTGCLTFTFTSNTIGTGNFTASATCETPCNNPIAGGIVLNGITNDSIHVCVGDEVFFQEQGTIAQPGFTIVDYEWDFMDGSSANGQNVSHVFDVPGQYRVQLFVTDDNGCSNPNLIDLEVLVGTIPTFDGFPTDMELCLGESAVLTADPNTYEVTWDGFPGSESVDDGCLTDDMLGVSQDIELLQTGFGAGTVIQDVNDIQSICLDLEHSFIGDLVVILECPNGQNVVMHQQGGGGVNLGIAVQADNVDCDDPATQGTPFTYCFTPSATQTWVQAIQGGAAAGNILPAGDYASVQPLANLVGCPTNGVWTLSVIDNWAADDGTLFSFGLTLDPSYYPDITSFTPQIGLDSDSSYWSGDASIITNLSGNADVVTIEPTNSGVYPFTYFVTDNFGCTYDSTMFITVNDNATLFAGNDTTICEGNTINLAPTLNNGSGLCNYELLLEDSFGDTWNNNTLTITVGGVATNYTLGNQNGGDWVMFPITIPNGENVTVTFNANGNWVGECEYTLTDEDGAIIVHNGPNLNGVQTTNFTSNCAPAYVFDWQAGTNLSNNTIENPTWTPTDDETLVLTVYPIGHPDCISTDDIAVTVIAPPNAGQDGVLDICSLADPVDLFDYLTNNPETTGTWTNAAGTVISMPFDPGVMAEGVYSYTVGADDCIDISTVTVTIIETEITNTVINDVTCNSGNDGSIDITGLNIDSYTLNGGGPVSVNSPFSVTGLIAGDYTIIVSSNDGCTDQVDFTVAEPLPLDITFISADTLICMGGTATLNVNGTGGSSAYTYTWTLNGATVGTGNTIVIDPANGVSNYCVEMSEACGSPTDSECMIVTTEDEIFPSLVPDTVAGCEPHQVDFINTSNGNIASTYIDFGDGFDSLMMDNGNFQHTFVNPQQYDLFVTITSNIGCVYNASFLDMITVYSNPQAGFHISPSPVSIFDTEVSLTDYSQGNVAQYDWYMPDGIPSTSHLENVTVVYPEGEIGTYPVTQYVTTEFGCVDSITKIVNVVNEVILYAPNTFTPDGDEFNQNWNIVLMGVDIYSYELKIYNRWGEMIYESNDKNIGWDGTYNGKVVQEGQYTWTIQCRDQYNDNKYTFDGFINVLR